MAMTPQESVCALLENREDPYVPGQWDCAEMIHWHLRACHAQVVKMPKPPLTAWKAVRTLGRPDSGPPAYGDIILQYWGKDLVAGIYVGWGVLTLTHGEGMAFIDLIQKYLRWNLGRWAR